MVQRWQIALADTSQIAERNAGFNNMKEIAMKTVEEKNSFMDLLQNESGRIGYFIAWLLGVPVSVLFVIFLIRGH